MSPDPQGAAESLVGEIGKSSAGAAEPVLRGQHPVVAFAGGNLAEERPYDVDVTASADAGPPTAGAAPRRAAPRTISPEVARRYLAIHHFLAPPRSLPAGPDGVLAVFDRL